MTALAQLFKSRIARIGPITLADYMADCLMHPEHGYYATRDPLGAAGDFTTAPEISQMFGELIGLTLAQVWLDQGSPHPFTLAELGPGRGTLMADILRATAGVAGFKAAAQVHLVETSPTLRAKQAELLGDVTFHDTVNTLPDQALFLIANEFFDALPIRQFTRDPAGWAEHVVGLQADALTLGQGPAAPISALQHRLADTKVGDTVEFCPALPAITQTISRQISAHGGVAIIIDYGDWASQGDTLQALAQHRAVSPFENPGEADLTAHVDFAEICRSLTAGTLHSRVTGQGMFLERLGITDRARQLAQHLTADALEAHIQAHRRLTHPDEMGTLFKVVALYPEGQNPPAGLEP